LAILYFTSDFQLPKIGRDTLHSRCMECVYLFYLSTRVMNLEALNTK
jgi:hypothetical protein